MRPRLPRGVPGCIVLFLFVSLIVITLNIRATLHRVVAVASESPPPSSDSCRCIHSLAHRAGLLQILNNGGEALRIACVGDSLTYGNGSHVGKTERVGEGNYPLTLARLLRCPHKVTVGNFGFSGATVSTVPKRKGTGQPFNTTRAFQGAMRFFPHIVILMLGTNDAKPKVWSHGVFTRHLRQLIRTLTSQPQMKVFYLMLPPPVTSHLGGIDSVTLESHVLPALRSFAVEQGLSTIDLHSKYAVTLHHDGVHPSRKGHDLIAHVVHDALCPS